MGVDGSQFFDVGLLHRVEYIAGMCLRKEKLQFTVVSREIRSDEP